MAVDVVLHWSEMYAASMVGVMRRVENIRVGRRDRYGRVDSVWDADIEGACGEKAVAKFLGLYWSGDIGVLKATDVGPIQVRTARDHNRRLILHPGDSDDQVWVLVTGLAPELKIQGWCYGFEGKLDRFWTHPFGAREPAFYVPSDELRDITQLVLR